MPMLLVAIILTFFHLSDKQFFTSNFFTHPYDAKSICTKQVSYITHPIMMSFFTEHIKHVIGLATNFVFGHFQNMDFVTNVQWVSTRITVNNTILTE